jgi:methionyl-tRNA synthetase
MAPALVAENMENFKFRQALTEMMNVARAGNKYLAETEPWKLIKTDEARVKTILNLSIQTCATLTILMEPFLPFTAKKLRAMLPDFSGNWPTGNQIELVGKGERIGEPEILFTKITDEEVQAQITRLEEAKSVNAADAYKPAPVKQNIDFDDFSKLDIRVATIKQASLVPKTKKLLKLELETGIETRTVVSGIAEFHKPEDIIGKQVLLLANLAPREIKGIQSEGMILMAKDANGNLVFAQPETQVKPGSQVY